MPRLPGGGDVPRVSPRVQSDPGIRTQPIQSTATSLSQELSPTIQKLAQVALRQENRRDTVDRSSRINEFNREADIELRRLNTEEDLSNEEVLRGFGTFLSGKRAQLLEDHRGSKDSQAVLLTRLQDLESTVIGRAAGLSIKLGKDKVVNTFNESLSPLISRAGEKPTLDNIDQLFLEFDSQLQDLRGAFDPSEEESFRDSGRETIAMSAIESLMARGRIETAASLLEDGGLNQSLSPDLQRDVQRRLEISRVAKEKTERVRTLSPRESNSMGFPEGSIVQQKSDGTLNIVFKPTADDTSRKQKIESIKKAFDSLDVPNPQQEAEAVVNGTKSVEVLESGQIQLVDTVRAIGGLPDAVKELPISPAESVPRAKIPREETLFSLSENATGLRAAVLRKTGRVPGTQITEAETEVTRAGSAFELVQNDLARALVFNDRFPVREREAVLEAFDIDPSIFDTPSALRVRLISVDRFLKTRVEQFERDVADPNLSQDIRSSQRANASAMRNAIDRIGVPEEGLFDSIKSAKDVETLSSQDIRFFIGQATNEELDALPPEVRQAMAAKRNVER